MDERGRKEDAGRLWQDILDSIDESVFLLDREGRVLRSNAAFVRAVGGRAEDIEGKASHLLLGDKATSMAERERVACIASGATIWFEYEEPGSGRIAEMGISPWKSPSGEVLGTIHLMRNVTEARTRQIGVAARSELLQSVFDAVPYPIYFMDSDSRYVGCNEAFAASVAGAPKASVPGRTEAELLGARAFRPLRADSDVVATGVPSFEELSIRFADGSLREVSLSRDAVRAADGRKGGMVGVVSDLTRERELRRELQAKNARLESANADLALAVEKTRELAERTDEANRAKSNFLAIMSHEIRTPLNGIIGMADLLADGPVNEEKREYIDILKLSADALLAIIDDILDFSKIEAGKMSIDLREFDLESVVEACLDILAAKSAQKGIELCASLDPAVPPGLSGDPVRLQQVLLNLVGNAVKFTDSGSVVLRVAASSRAKGSVSLRFSIKDTGIGIPAEKIPSLFQQFNQVDGSSARRYGGTGLGLALSKKLVELMGGTIGVESAPGAGSEFWFVLPFSCAEAAERRAQAPGGGPARRVLALGLSAASAETIAAMLRAEGVELDAEAGIPPSFPAAPDGSAYAAVLVDEGAEGALAREELRAPAGASPPPIFLLASPGSVRDDAGAAEAGLAGIVHAPLKRRQVLALLAPRAPEPARQAPEKGGARPGAGRWRVLVAEDNDINTIIIRKILDKEGIDYQTVRNGREAVEALSRSRFDCVFLDLYMPVMDGFEAVRAIRDPAGPVLDHGVPVAALSASSLREDREKCRAAGIDEFILKPVKVRTIHEALDRLLPGRLAPAEPADELLDTLGGDAGLFAELVEKFASDTGKRLEAIRRAVEGEKPAGAEELKRLAHAVTGSALSMGAGALAEAARALGRAPEDAASRRDLLSYAEEKAAEAAASLRAAAEKAKRRAKA